MEDLVWKVDCMSRKTLIGNAKLYVSRLHKRAFKLNFYSIWHQQQQKDVPANGLGSQNVYIIRLYNGFQWNRHADQIYYK